MNHYSINILKCDIPFVTEAVRMRGNAMADAILNQIAEIENRELVSKLNDAQPPEWEVKEFDDQLVAALASDKKIKKAVEAPYGYRLDGTPKKRPGRPTKKGRK